MMIKGNSFFLLTILLLSIVPLAICQFPPQLTFTGAHCSKYDNVTINGTYHTNLGTLLSTLRSQSSTSMFSTSSAGDGGNRVNGLFVCRPDLPLATCERCVDFSISFFHYAWDNKKECILWYDECTVRYSNRTIFSSKKTSHMDEVEPWTGFKYFYNVTKPSIFPRLLKSLMGKLIGKASSPKNALRFATGKVNFTLFEGLYGMAQCTPDLTSSECRHCLITAFNRIPSDNLRQGVKIFQPSCQIRYDTAPFIASDLLPPPSLTAPAPS